MKTLYFDVDGTVLLAASEEPKPRLAGGALESAIRRAGIERLVCVGNFCRIAAFMHELQIDYDGLGVLFGLCRGAFTDEPWFRAVTALAPDPEHRGSLIEATGDWWYVDDLAREYLGLAGREDLLDAHLGGRVLVPDPNGSGQDVLDWLHSVVA